ncbi:FkbM family methyltransferase [Pseudohaliea sp.]|uniref:FkbM family methyltransferase n=1 Tax=Pseudohaliea sp. TaxID=2740289 RepID=UPI0032EA961D
MSILKTLCFITSHPLNEGREIAALCRFAKWQLSSRMAPGAVVVDWISGTKLLVRNGETGLTGNIYTGLHEFIDMAYVLHLLRKADVFADVGANAGSYSILACGAVGARGFAFEPVPATHARLVENLRLNCIEECVDHPQIGIGKESGIIRFTTDGDTVNHVLAEGEVTVDAVDVEVLTLDEALGASEPMLLKIDVEGFEMPVLMGASRVLNSSALNSVIIELNGSGSRYGFDESLILELMFDYGFRSYAYDPFTRSLDDLAGESSDSGNTLFIRDLQLAKARVQSARGFRVNGREI